MYSPPATTTVGDSLIVIRSRQLSTVLDPPGKRGWRIVCLGDSRFTDSDSTPHTQHLTRFTDRDSTPRSGFSLLSWLAQEAASLSLTLTRACVRVPTNLCFGDSLVASAGLHLGSSPVAYSTLPDALTDARC